MAYIFQSIFALEFKSFLVMVRDAGQQTRGYEATFKSLDTFLSEIPGQEKALAEETVGRWLDSLSCKPQSKKPADNPYPGILQIPESHWKSRF